MAACYYVSCSLAANPSQLEPLIQVANNGLAAFRLMASNVVVVYERGLGYWYIGDSSGMRLEFRVIARWIDDCFRLTGSLRVCCSRQDVALNGYDWDKIISTNQFRSRACFALRLGPQTMTMRTIYCVTRAANSSHPLKNCPKAQSRG